MFTKIEIFESRLVLAALKNIYCTDKISLQFDVPFIWQAPILTARVNENMLERMYVASNLWLRNIDMRLSNELVMIDENAAITLVCKRPERLGETGKVYGPMDGKHFSEGVKRIADSSVLFVERYKNKIYTK
jgi:hypothetical protein